MKTFPSLGISSILLFALGACSDDNSPLVLDAAPASDDTASDDGTSDEAGADSSSELIQGTDAEIEWRDCGQFENRNLECAEVEVPIDYDQPDGDTLLLSVRRILANPLEPYHGALLFNPGGPGG